VNKKYLLVVFTLAAILLATPIVSAAIPNRGQNKKQLVDYKSDGYLGDSLYTTTVEYPYVYFVGYRPQESILEYSMTINGEEYSYPEDFSYAETFTLTYHIPTETLILDVVCVFTFNLPGNPTITEHISSEGISEGVYSGSFVLDGTKMFNKVMGGGTESAFEEEDILHAIHEGQIMGWPF